MLYDLPGIAVAEWQAFYNLELRGEDRSDWRFGMLASIIANVNRGKKDKPFTPVDFIPKWADRAEQYQDDDVEEVDNSATLAMMATFTALTKNAADVSITPVIDSDTETSESQLISVPLED